MSVIAFSIIMWIVGLSFIGLGVGLAVKCINSLFSDWPNGLSIFIIAVGVIIITLYFVAVVLTPCDKVKIGRKIPIAVDSIDAYNLNDKQQYKITIDDGTVYDTASSIWDENDDFVFVEESDDNEFHLYNVTYQKQRKIIFLVLTDGESTALVLEVPHEYYVLHKGEQDNNMTRVYTSNE